MLTINTLIFIIICVTPLSNCNSTISATLDHIKHVLYNYDSSLRHRRDANRTIVGGFTDDLLGFLNETERYGEWLRYWDAGACGGGPGGAGDAAGGAGGNFRYVKRHIHHGLLLDEHVPETHWFEYKSVFRKRYRTGRHEAAARRRWRDNARHVATHNRQFLAGRTGFALHLNHLADFGPSEYTRRMLKLLETPALPDPALDPRRRALARPRRPAPRSVDWRSRGFRPRRARQAACGACYAFAAAHALQAQLYRRGGRWADLSAQQIVDCSGGDGNAGCAGGSLRAAFRYMTREGLHTEADYPYRGKRGVCRVGPWWRARARRWALLPAGDEAALERALAAVGPLAVAVNAAPRSFQLYRSGIYDDPLCAPWALNHAMLLVGYSRNHWTLLNWWGRHWGEDGYIRIRRGLNICGVANMAAYVEL